MNQPILFLVTFCFSISVFPYAAAAGEAEKQLVAKCAISSQGQPAAFAYCTIGGLYFAEVKKCLIGEAGECMGDSNTFMGWIKSFNKRVLNSCGFRSPDAVRPAVFFINNTDRTVSIDLEFETGPGGHGQLAPGHYTMWDLDWCDTWVNVDAPGGKLGFEAGEVVEFQYGVDGNIYPYPVTRSTR